MKSRHKAREVALQILYQYDLGLQQIGQPIPVGNVLSQNLKHHFEHFSVPDALQFFVGQLVTGTLTQLAILDPIIEKNAVNWKVSRMSSVDRCLLRMATYEMLYLDQNVSRTIVIDEAIELAKHFGTSDTPSFINGILDSIKDHTLIPSV